MLLFIPCLFFTGFENIYKSFFYGVKTIKPNIIGEISELSIRIITVFILLSANRDSLTPAKTAYLIVLAMIISEIFSFSFLGLYYKNYIKKFAEARIARPQKQIQRKLNTAGEHSSSTHKNILSEIARIAVPISASSLLMTIITSVNTILIPKRLAVAGMSGTQAIETLGILMGMAFPLVTIPVIFITPLMNVMFPRITSAIKLGDKKDMNDKIAKVFQSCSFMTFPAMGVVAAIGGPLCVLMYRNEIAGSYIFPLVLSSVFMYIQMVTGSILYALDQQKKLAVYNFIDGVIHIIFTYVFVAMPDINVYGFMLGHFASSFCGTVLNTVTVVKYSKIKIDYTGWFILPAISGIYTGLMAYFTYNFCMRLSFAPVLSVITALLFSILIYISILQLRDINVMKYVKKLIGAKNLT
jgi:O-antigen/teichoic acid export membrane protein